MIIKIDKGNYYLVYAGDENGKPNGNHFKIKGDDRLYSQATEFKDKPREYEEIINDPEN